MTITRTSPDCGYLDASVLDPIGVSQLVVHNDTVYWSGVVSARTTDGKSEVVAIGDMEGQLRFILDVIARSLTTVGSDASRILTLTMFTRDVPALSAVLAGVLGPWAGEHRPCVTVIGIDRLAYADLLIEVQGVAALKL